MARYRIKSEYLQKALLDLFENKSEITILSHRIRVNEKWKCSLVADVQCTSFISRSLPSPQAKAHPSRPALPTSSSPIIHHPSSFPTFLYLQGISEQLVHLCDSGWDTKVNCSVANLHDESSEDIGVDLYYFVSRCSHQFGEGCWLSYLVCDLELLSWTNVRGLWDGSLKTRESLAIQLLE